MDYIICRFKIQHLWGLIYLREAKYASKRQFAFFTNHYIKCSVLYLFFVWAGGFAVAQKLKFCLGDYAQMWPNDDDDDGRLKEELGGGGRKIVSRNLQTRRQPAFGDCALIELGYFGFPINSAFRVGAPGLTFVKLILQQNSWQSKSGGNGVILGQSLFAIYSLICSYFRVKLAGAGCRSLFASRVNILVDDGDCAAISFGYYT